MTKIEERNSILKDNENRYIEYETNKQNMELLISKLKEEINVINKKNLSSVKDIDYNNSLLELKEKERKIMIEEYNLQIKTLQASLDKKVQETNRLQEEFSIIKKTLSECHQKEIEVMQAKIFNLEKQVIEATHTSSDKSIADLQNEKIGRAHV